LIEGWALGCFMLSAAFFTLLLEHPGSPLRAVAVLNTCGERAASKAMWMGPARPSTFPLFETTSTCWPTERYPPGDEGPLVSSGRGPRLYQVQSPIRTYAGSSSWSIWTISPA